LIEVVKIVQDHEVFGLTAAGKWFRKEKPRLLKPHFSWMQMLSAIIDDSFLE